MIASKQGELVAKTQTTQECCCMCGDHGLSFELFRCKLCHFRSQHRYCSNQYPKAESYGVCNWCLMSQKDDDKAQNSSNSSSSICKDVHDHNTIKKKKSNNNHHGGAGLVRDRRVNLKIQLNATPIKKQKVPPEQLPASAARKRIMTIGGGGGGLVGESIMMRKSKVEELSSNGGGGGGGGITKQVFRNKVRRYKLLDEVSSQ